MTEEEHDRYDNCKRGNIHSDFALDFLKKNETCLIAADKGLEFFLEHQLLPVQLLEILTVCLKMEKNSWKFRKKEVWTVKFPMVE